MRLLIALLLAPLAVMAGEFVLADKGVAPAPIIVFKDAPPRTRAAAVTLAKYVEKSCGTKPVIIDGEPATLPERAIWIGVQPAVKKLFPKLDFEFKHPEEILIAASEKHLVIAGRDRWDPAHMVAKGRLAMKTDMQQEYGTANAVYTFLQEKLGVRWLWPGEEDVVRRERIAIAAYGTDGVKEYRNLAYVANGHDRQKLDLFLPEKATGPLPLIIWVHGGGWAAGSKDGCPPLRAGYTERGYAVASIGYRLSGDAIFPAQIEDCKAAVRWLRAHAKEYGLNPDRFGVWGSSAGGHLVALLGTSGDVSSRVQAVCDYYGPTDLLQMDAHALPSARLKHDPATSPESRLIGGAIQENKEKTTRANPIVYVTPDDPPFLIVHGDADPVVPIHQSQLLFEALKKAGVSVRFHTIKGAGHGQGFGGREIDEMVNNFFDSYLKGNTAPARAATQTESAASTMPPVRAGKKFRP